MKLKHNLVILLVLSLVGQQTQAGQSAQSAKRARREAQLRIASEYGSLSLVQQYLNQDSEGADVDFQDDLSGTTPLHLAMANGHDPIAFALMTHGASPTFQNAYGYSGLR